MSEAGFNIKSGLIEPMHRKLIGIAIWEFLWCIDRVTEEYADENGAKWGLVYKGKPVQAEEIAEELGTHPETVKKNLRNLVAHNYLRLKRTPYGNIIEVAKSSKWRPKKETEKDKQVAKEQNQADTQSPGYRFPVEVPNSSSDRIPSPEGVPSPSDLKIICDYLAKKMGRIEVSLKDVSAIKRKLSLESMIKEIIITGIDKSFINFKPEYDGDKIRSFSYCEPAVMDEYRRALMQADRGEKDVKTGKRIRGPTGERIPTEGGTIQTETSGTGKTDKQRNYRSGKYGGYFK